MRINGYTNLKALYSIGDFNSWSNFQDFFFFLFSYLGTLQNSENLNFKNTEGISNPADFSTFPVFQPIVSLNSQKLGEKAFKEDGENLSINFPTKIKDPIPNILSKNLEEIQPDDNLLPLFNIALILLEQSLNPSLKKEGGDSWASDNLAEISNPATNSVLEKELLQNQDIGIKKFQKILKDLKELLNSTLKVENLNPFSKENFSKMEISGMEIFQEIEGSFFKEPLLNQLSSESQKFLKNYLENFFKNLDNLFFKNLDQEERGLSFFKDMREAFSNLNETSQKEITKLLRDYFKEEISGDTLAGVTKGETTQFPLENWGIKRKEVTLKDSWKENFNVRLEALNNPAEAYLKLHQLDLTKPLEVPQVKIPTYRVPFPEVNLFIKNLTLEISPSGERKAEIQLEPPEMGKIELEVKIRDGEVEIYAKVEKTETFSQLQQDLTQLKAQLEDLGLRLKEFQLEMGFFMKEREFTQKGEGGSQKREKGQEELKEKTIEKIEEKGRIYHQGRLYYIV